MKTSPLNIALIGVVALLVALLWHQIRLRKVAEVSLRRVTSEAPARGPTVEHPDREKTDLIFQLDSLLQENRRLREREAATKSVVSGTSADKVATLKDTLARLPEQAIPELQLATDGDWFSAVDGPLETAEDYRRAMAKRRALSQRRFAVKAQPALRAFLQSNGNVFPKEVPQLASYFDGPMDAAILQRYKVVPATEVKNVRVGGEWAITQGRLIDSTYDTITVIGPNGHGAFSRKKGAVPW